MEYPVDVAYCHLLFRWNGGQFWPSGRPQFVEGVSSVCDKGYDCGQCEILHHWVNAVMQIGYEVSWRCPDCVRDLFHEFLGGHRAQKGSHRTVFLANIPVEEWGFLVDGKTFFFAVPGHFQAGRPPRHPDDPKYDPDQPPIPGCTVCGRETSFLQLVLTRVAQ